MSAKSPFSRRSQKKCEFQTHPRSPQYFFFCQDRITVHPIAYQLARTKAAVRATPRPFHQSAFDKIATYLLTPTFNIQHPSRSNTLQLHNPRTTHTLTTPSTQPHHVRLRRERLPRQLAQERDEAQQTEHLNIKVTDNNNEVFFKIKRTTQLKKLMDAFCERQGKAPSSVRFLFDGSRVQATDSPDTLDMQDGDTLEVHQEQIGGCASA
ncbi:hypothetical protein VE04_08976 [Pseudogymnoascus sp. 24MN13]|nr:hypothetical protein VE04_08976 [Pseudogymnoascus sp. 24MN13]